MLKKASVFFLLFLVVSIGVAAQSSSIYTSEYAEFQHGLKLYMQNQYTAAQRIFQQITRETEHGDLKEQTAYYDALSAALSDQPDAESRLLTFSKEYPESPRRNSAFATIGKHYFDRGQYSKSGKWYDQVEESDLSHEERDTYYFNQAYISFTKGDKNKAENYFNRVVDSDQYASQANYYLGFLAYEGEDYTRAEELFQGVDESEKASKNVSYFQSDMSFKSGDFEKAIRQAEQQLPRSNRREQSELNKIIGESYFNLEEYDRALAYLEKYEGKNGKWNNTDYYQLGYTYFQRQEYEKAISQFNKIIDGKDEVAQNAYYHLAQSYINLDQKQQALNAFKNASEMPYNAVIKEDAALNYAKLSYDIGNSYKSVPEVLNDFLAEFPSSPAKSDIQRLLVNSYVTSKNYEQALTLLENNDNAGDQEIYQKVAFYRGLELYRENRYRDAIGLFEKSLRKPSDPTWVARATYWKAESEYNLENYKEALIGYQEFVGMRAAQETQEFKTVDYNMGYAYFNQQKYDGAQRHFKSYLAKNPENAQQQNDAYLRLGDSYFANSEYWLAMEEYNKAIAQKNVHSDYAYYQKAISYGFVDRNQRKIEDLNSFIKNYPSSKFYEDALYELGNTYIAENQDQQGISAYDKIVKEKPNSRLVSKALLRQGLVYYNRGENQNALEKFKTVASQFPNTEEAHQSVASARNIYVDLGQTDEYARWVKTLDFVEVTERDIDDVTFQSAENQFIDGNDQNAISGFEKYLEQFPSGAQALSAHYHLGQLYYKQNQNDKAKQHYQNVVKTARNDYTERSLERLSRIYLEEGDANSALPLLEELEEVAKSSGNLTFAQSNLMKIYYENDDFEKTVTYADKVLNNDRIETRVKNDAQIFSARSALRTGQEDLAQQAYKEVAKTAQGRQAAEAQYYDAYFKRKAEAYQASNEAVQVLAKDYSSYKEFSVKGLLLMGKNFYDLGDAYQATYILQNVIDNFSEFPESVEEAQAELNRIKQEEAKTNSSLENR